MKAWFFFGGPRARQAGQGLKQFFAKGAVKNLRQRLFGVRACLGLSLSRGESRRRRLQNKTVRKKEATYTGFCKYVRREVCKDPARAPDARPNGVQRPLGVDPWAEMRRATGKPPAGTALKKGGIYRKKFRAMG